MKSPRGVAPQSLADLPIHDTFVVVCRALEDIVDPSIQRTTDQRKLRNLRGWCGALRDYAAECESVLADVSSETDRRGDANGSAGADRGGPGRKRQRRNRR